MKILVCNVGSTSLKFKLMEMPREKVYCEAKVERVGSETSAIYSYKNLVSEAKDYRENLCIPNYKTGIRLFLESMTAPGTGVLGSVTELSGIGYKSVISKGFYGVHELTEEVMQGMRDYLFIAPVHNSAYIEAITQFQTIVPDVPMIGVFETAFHETIPVERRLYSVPYQWYEKYGIMKMGFHGASHEYVSQEAKALGKADYIISCHLGGSSSICAIRDGKSVDSSFGFSLQTGIMHANRCGDIDPYIIPFLSDQGMEMEEILKALSKSSGLLGLSGVSNDLRDIIKAKEEGNERAQLAAEAFVYNIVHYIGAFYAELGGLDQLVFTGGIGENSVEIRGMVCGALQHMGILLDADLNANTNASSIANLTREPSPCQTFKGGVISKPHSKVIVSVIPANEELGIARRTYSAVCRD